MSGVGACGLKAIEWGGARKALRRLGAIDNGVSSKHSNRTMRLPTGTVVELGKATEPRQRAHRGRVGVFLALLEAEGITPLLFLAALDAAGGAVWLRRDPEVDRMRSFLRHWPGKTTDQASWTAIWKAYEDYATTEEPEVAMIQERKTEERTYTLREVAELSGLKVRPAYERLRLNIVAKRAPFDQLLADGAIAYVPRPPKAPGRGTTMVAFTERAALIAAEWLAPPAPESPQEPQEPEPAAPAPAEVVEAAPEPLVAPAPAPEPWPVAGEGPAWALVELCRHHGVTWAFDGYAIDVDATHLRLQAALDRAS